ncbi:hypothetical protein C0995_008376 [Termitomyces sp. Mi166|nr:hypothetical protein C0995_008376 [Termitomyces sp. Mi166\
MSDHELVYEFAKLFGVPATHNQLTNPKTEPFPPCSETRYECETLEDVDFVNFSRAPSSVHAKPVAEAEAAPSVPTKAGSPESKSDTTVFKSTIATSTSADTSADTTATATATDTMADTTSTEIASSFNKICAIEAAFNALKARFTLPAELDFLPSTSPTPSSTPSVCSSPASSDTETTSVTDHLTYSPALTALLEQLDEVESLGDADLRRSRKEVVRRVEQALEELERKIEGWGVGREGGIKEGEYGSERDDDDEKEDKAKEGEVSVSGLDENSSEQEGDGKKQNRFDERADVVFVPSPTVSSFEEQEKSSTTTVKTITTTTTSSDDAFTRVETTETTSVHDDISIEATPGDHVEGIPALGKFDLTESVDSIDSIRTSVQPAIRKLLSTADSLSGDALTNPSPLPRHPYTNQRMQPSIDISIEAAAKPYSFLSSTSSPLDENTERTTINSDVDTLSTPATLIQSIDVEAEDIDVFFLTPREAEETAFKRSNAENGDDDWLEVDALM